MPNSYAHKKGFTLVELLITIAILLILTMIGLFIYRDINAKARDATRLQDLDSLQKAIGIALSNATSSAAILCTGTTPPCEGTSYPADASTQHTDGTGWIKISFDDKDASFNKLPIDPLNDATYNYHYYSDGTDWKIDTGLESPQNQGQLTNDGGTKSDRYEVGTHLKNLP